MEHLISGLLALLPSLAIFEVVMYILTKRGAPRHRMPKIAAAVFSAAMMLLYLVFYWAVIVKFHTSDAVSYTVFGLAGLNLVAICLYLFKKTDAISGPLRIVGKLLSNVLFFSTLGMWTLLRGKRFSMSRFNAWLDRNKVVRLARIRYERKLPALGAVRIANALMIAILVIVVFTSNSPWFSWYLGGGLLLVIAAFIGGIFLARNSLSRYINWHTDRNFIVAR